MRNLVVDLNFLTYRCHLVLVYLGRIAHHLTLALVEMAVEHLEGSCLPQSEDLMSRIHLLSNHMCSRTSHINRWLTEGHAALKSNRTMLGFVYLREYSLEP